MRARERTALWAAGLVVAMGGLSFAAVPFYSWFCAVTGFGGSTMVGSNEGMAVSEETVTIRFVATTDRGMPWIFKPVETEMTLRLGETGLAFYEATNPTARPIAGQATYNVTPYAAGGYFSKIECFCFTEQVLQPGETVLMPVSFFVDPAILDDPEGSRVREITLGYTFYETDVPQEQAALALTAPRPRAID